MSCQVQHILWLRSYVVRYSIVWGWGFELSDTAWSGAEVLSCQVQPSMWLRSCAVRYSLVWGWGLVLSGIQHTVWGWGLELANTAITDHIQPTNSQTNVSQLVFSSAVFTHHAKMSTEINGCVTGSDRHGSKLHILPALKIYSYNLAHIFQVVWIYS